MKYWQRALTNFSDALGIGRPKYKKQRGNSLKRQLRMEYLEGRQMLSITVNTLVDENNFLNVGGRSLREAINEAQPGELINFEPGLNGTITLTHGELPTINKSLTINASGHSITIDAVGNDNNSAIDNGGGSRIFNITDQTSGDDPPLVTIIGLHLTHGDVSGEGGAIFSTGQLVLQNCVIDHNASTSQGGGVFVFLFDGSGNDQRTALTLVNTRIDDNTSGNGGGGVFVQGSRADVSILEGSSISGNTSSVDGGGIYSKTYQSQVHVEDSTISGNTSGSGGGGLYTKIGQYSSLAVEHSTISGNTASGGRGGAISVFALDEASYIHLTNNSIVSGNTSGLRGGGLYVKFTESTPLVVEDSTISLNTATGGEGGGIFLEASKDSSLPSMPPRAITISRSTISGNHANNRGGGIYARSYGAATMLVEESLITGNDIPLTATGARDGGGIWLKSEQHSTFEITKSTISDNFAPGTGGGLFAITSDYTDTRRTAFTITQSLISGNKSSHRGAGAYIRNYIDTDVLIADTRITQNSNIDTTDSHVVSNSRDGGGLYVYLTEHTNDPSRKPKFTILDTTIDNNITDFRGGGVYVCVKDYGDFVMVNSTISANKTLGVATSASGSFDGIGGGISLVRLEGPGDPRMIDAYLRNVTITQNVSETGGGLSTKEQSGMNVRLDNTIVSGNVDSTNAANNLNGPVVVGESFNNLVGPGSTILDSNNLSTVPSATLTANGWILATTNDPKLGLLQNNGGLTPTHALLSDSPAIDAGSNTWATMPLTNNLANQTDDEPLMSDQRGPGFTRFFDVPGIGVNGSPPRVDIGAYEIGLPKVVDVILNGVQWDSSHTNSTPWTRDPYSFAELVPLGKQLAPIYTYGVNSIQIIYSEAVTKPNGTTTLDGTEFELRRTGLRNAQTWRVVAPKVNGFTFSSTNVATWEFATPLVDDRYQIYLEPTKIRGLAGYLDGHWDNKTNGTFYDWRNDPDSSSDPTRRFPSGNGIGGTAFQFLFALLTADYNQDGYVDAGDYDTWRHPPQTTDADGNGDGSKSDIDYNVWLAYGPNSLVFLRQRGDYDGDGLVNMADWTLWRSTYGSTSNLAADADGSGVIDQADYVIWRVWVSTWSGWNLGIFGAGASLNVVDSSTAPRVTNVTISGSHTANENGSQDHYSFATHVGSGEQLQTVPVGGADTVSITFSEQVNVDATYLRIGGLRTAYVPVLADFVYDAATMTATWRFDDLIANDQYLISLSDFITDTQGYRLDGEWVNPATTTTTNLLVSEFPSGDGHAGGNFDFVVTLLAADANLDNIVDTSDYQIWQTYWAQDGGYLEGDFDGDGIVGDYDLPLWQFTEGVELQSIAMLGDLNGDFVVDDSDADVILTNFGMSSATHNDGDLNGDGNVNLADVDLFFAQYGLGVTVVS